MKIKTSSSAGRKGLQALLPNVPRETLEQLFQYAELLFHWNQHINLTGAKTLSEIFIQIADCALAGHRVSSPRCWLDIGSGAGLPGLVWAILFKESKYTLIESSQKKVGFLHRAVSALKLEGVKIIHARAEDVGEKELMSMKRDETHCVSRGTMSPAPLLRLMTTIPFEWKAWAVFSTVKTHRDFLTLSKKFDMRIKSIRYFKPMKKKENPKGIITILQRKNDPTIH